MSLRSMTFSRDRSFLQCVHAFILYKKLIFVFVCIGLAAGLTYYWASEKFYRADIAFISSSKSQMSSVPSDRESTSMLVLSSIVAASAAEKTNLFFLSLLKSNLVLDKVIQLNALDSAWHLKRPPAARSLLIKRMKTTEEKGGVVHLEFYDTNPILASKIASDLVTTLNEVLNDLTITDAQRALKFLEKRIDLAQKELAITTADREYRLKEAIYLALMKEYELSRVRAARDHLAVTVIDSAESTLNPVLPRLNVTLILTFAISFLFAVLFIVVVEYYKALKANPDEKRILDQICSSFKRTA